MKRENPVSIKNIPHTVCARKMKWRRTNCNLKLISSFDRFLALQRTFVSMQRYIFSYVDQPTTYSYASSEKYLSRNMRETTSVACITNRSSTIMFRYLFETMLRYFWCSRGARIIRVIRTITLCRNCFDHCYTYLEKFLFNEELLIDTNVDRHLYKRINIDINLNQSISSKIIIIIIIIRIIMMTIITMMMGMIVIIIIIIIKITCTFDQNVNVIAA